MEQLIPKLRFPEFKGEWEKKEIKNILTIGNGKDYKHLKYGDIPVYGTGGIITYVDEFLLDELSVGIGRKGTINKPILLKNPFWTVDTLFYTYNYIESNLYFVYYLFNTINWLKYNEASGVPSLSKSTIKSIKITTPSLPEQQKIADYLSTIDRKLELLRQKKEQLECYKKGMMQQLFSQQVRFKDDNGNNYPEWQEKRLGEIGKTYSGLTSKNKSHFGIGKDFYITYKQIYDNASINTMLCEKVLVDLKEKQNEVRNGDVFFTISSETRHEVGMSSVILKQPKPRGRMFLNSFSFGFRALSLNIFIPLFAKYIFRDSNFRRAILPLAQGSTRYNISKSEFLKLKINLPSLPEQKKIADFLSALDSKIEGVGNQIEQTEAFKKAMLQQLFV